MSKPILEAPFIGTMLYDKPLPVQNGKSLMFTVRTMEGEEAVYFSPCESKTAKLLQNFTTGNIFTVAPDGSVWGYTSTKTGGDKKLKFNEVCNLAVQVMQIADIAFDCTDREYGDQAMQAYATSLLIALTNNGNGLTALEEEKREDETLEQIKARYGV